MTRRIESGTVSLVIGYIYQVLTQYTDLVKPAFDEVKRYDTAQRLRRLIVLNLLLIAVLLSYQEMGRRYRPSGKCFC